MSAGNLSFEVKGMDILFAGLGNMRATMLTAAAQALNEVAEETMTASKELVPVQYGVLKGSGKVSETATPSSLKTQLTYGTEYAVYVHEIPPPPLKSPKGRSATHRVGQWKYLETPVKRRQGTLAQDIANKMRGILGL